MDISRRKFVQISALAPLTYVFPFSAGVLKDGKYNLEPAGKLYKAFKTPSGAARPFVRWWWNGDRITRDELLRELDLLKEKGISGVEINPIAFPAGDDPMNYKAYKWLGDDWLNMLKATLEGAKKRGLICDIIVGSGWPFGGEFLNKDEQIQLLALGTKNLKGPKQYTIKKHVLLKEMDPLSVEETYRELSVLRLAPALMDAFQPGIDLNDKIKDEEITIDVPEGDHVLYYLVKLTGCAKVSHGAPGAQGPVLNHYNKGAVQKYLDRMSGGIVSKIGNMGNYFRAIFVDSLELHGSNWCDDMREEFKRRKGYDLQPYLPFILFKIDGKSAYNGKHLLEEYGTKFSPQVQDKINRVRYDFESTRLALFQERFLDTFTAWCKKNGVKSRVQTYGREYYPLESAMRVDIPECETWLRPDTGGDLKENSFSSGRGYRPVNKFISSAARLTGKKEVSCEEITNTSLVFNATLERVKITGDQSNLSGVTHSILHGFNYSPKDVPFPGWVRYGTFFNERNPWWPYLKTWIDYKARLSAVFQEAELYSDVAVMFPTADLWSMHGVQYEQWPQIVYPAYAFNVWEAIHQNGSGCDYISEHILRQSTFSKGHIQYGPRSYKVLLMLEVESIDPGTAKALEKFAGAGGLVLFIGKDPVKSPGLDNHEKNDALVRETIASLKRRFPENAVSYPAPRDEIIKWYAGIQSKFKIAPAVKFDRPVSHVSQVHYQTKKEDIFFISNYHLKKPHQFTATFNIKNRTAWIWDPETGERYLYPYEDSKNKLKFDLDPAASRLIVFAEEHKGGLFPVRRLTPNTYSLEGPWDVTLHKVDGKNKKTKFDKLIDLKDDKEFASFAGTILYKKTFSPDHPGNYAYLDLGAVHGISDVRVNGRHIGAKWYGKHIYRLDDILKAGDNTLEIKITTVLGNYAKSLKNNQVAQRWTRKQPLYSMGLLGPVKLS